MHPPRVKFVRQILSEILKLLGFDGPADLAASAYGLKLYSLPLLKIQLSGTLLATGVFFCTQFIWDPPSALFLLVALDLLNAVYGYQVSKKLKGVGFRFDEFQRTFGKVISTLLVLAILKNAINAYEFFKAIDLLVFGWLFMTKARKVVSKMVALKVQEEGLPGVIQQFISSKLGALLVDAAQGVKPATGPIAVPEQSPAPPPATGPDPATDSTMSPTDL